MILDLDLHKYRAQLSIKEKDGKKWLWCPIRKMLLVPQPEELVRQLLIIYLIEEKGYPLSRIQVEKAIQVNGQLRRFDILVYSADLEPLVIIECKAHTEALTQQVLDQAGQYNTTLKAPYLLVSNGVNSIMYSIDLDQKVYKALEEVIDYSRL